MRAVGLRATPRPEIAAPGLGAILPASSRQRLEDVKPSAVGRLIVNEIRRPEALAQASPRARARAPTARCRARRLGRREAILVTEPMDV
jgi:hypothetical protein